MDRDIEEKAALIRALLDQQPTNAANSTIQINAGGIGVWVSASACAVMLAVNLVLVVILVDHNRQIGRMQDHLTALYMMAPHLKPGQDLKNSP